MQWWSDELSWKLSLAGFQTWHCCSLFWRRSLSTFQLLARSVIAAFPLIQHEHHEIESIYHKVDRRHIVRAARVTHPSATIRPNLSWLSWLFFFRPKFKIIMWCWKHFGTPISCTISRWFLWQTIWANIWPRWPKGYLGAKTFVFLAKKRNFDGMDLLGTSSLGRHQDYGPKYLAVFFAKKPMSAKQ